MPSTETKLAWAVEVKVHKLGASLEAYNRLKPTFSTLRLCNRFGHGEKAAVNKLPVELVQQVEDLLMQEERADTLSDWTQNFECWQADCEPIDHIDDAEILSLYNEFRAEMGWSADGSDDDSECCGCGCAIRQPLTEVTDDMREFMDEDIKMCNAEGAEHMWRDKHDARVNEWCKQVGHPTSSSRGLFDTLAKVLDSDFGLNVWISHVQQPGVPEHTGENVAQSTKAYLHLPSSCSRKQLWDPVIADHEYDPRRKPTESGSAYQVKLPRKPSENSLARFDRALKILGLETVCDAPKTSASKSTASAEDGQPDFAAPRPAKSRSKPKLTMFVRNCDESEW